MSHTCFRVNPHSTFAWMLKNSLLEAGAFGAFGAFGLLEAGALAGLAKWLSVCLWIKWLWVRVQLQSVYL